MVPSRTNKRGDRRARQNKNSGSARATIALSQSDMRERQLASRSDRVSIRGKAFFTSADLTAATYNPLNPAFFGDRVLKHAALYARWRIIKLVLQNGPTNVTSSTATFQAYGIVDDYTAEGGSVPLPTSIAEVVELRCARTNLSSVNPSEIEWKPLDPSKLYYSQSGAAATPADPRFAIPGTLVVISNNATAPSLSFVVYYTIEFEGAFDNSA